MVLLVGRFIHCLNRNQRYRWRDNRNKIEIESMNVYTAYIHCAAKASAKNLLARDYMFAFHVQHNFLIMKCCSIINCSKTTKKVGAIFSSLVSKYSLSYHEFYYLQIYLYCVTHYCTIASRCASNLACISSIVKIRHLNCRITSNTH